MQKLAHMDGIRKKFPVVQQYIYANTAATGLLSEDLMEWRQEHDLDYLIKGSMLKSKANEMLERTRKVVGDFFNCPTANVALLPCFSVGLNLLLEGLDKKEKVLLLQGDYPSLSLPFKSRGFVLEQVAISATMEQEIYDIVKTKSITVLAFSVVQWLNGILIDLNFIQQLKKDFPDLMILADGTQFLGTQAFDFTDSGIDILGSSAYKWLLSGYGNGLMMIKDEVKHRFSMVSKGYGSGRNTLEGEEYRTFCKHLEPGHLDSLSMGSLEFSLHFLKSLGMDTIEKQLELLSKHAKRGFAQLGLLEDSVLNRQGHSTIFNIKANEKLFMELTKNDVIGAQRGDGIRLSFHFYNTLEEIDAILKILKK